MQTFFSLIIWIGVTCVIIAAIVRWVWIIDFKKVTHDIINKIVNEFAIQPTWLLFKLGIALVGFGIVSKILWWVAGQISIIIKYG